MAVLDPIAMTTVVGITAALLLLLVVAAFAAAIWYRGRRRNGSGGGSGCFKKGRISGGEYEWIAIGFIFPFL